MPISPQLGVRRRYGTIRVYGKPGVQQHYYEYTLLFDPGTGKLEEDKSTTAFHVLPKETRELSAKKDDAKATSHSTPPLNSAAKAPDGAVVRADSPATTPVEAPVEAPVLSASQHPSPSVQPDTDPLALLCGAAFADADGLSA